MRLRAKHLATTIVILAAASVSACASAPERQGPWCSVINYGTGNVVEDCRFSSIEACRQEVIGGSRGTCTQNPRWRTDGRAKRR